MPFLIIRNDITKVQADGVVNPANEKLLEGSGTSRAIFLAAGERKLAAACRKIGHCDLGKAAVTKAYGLRARYIIHAVGPVWIDGKHGEEEILYSAYRESMLLARQYCLESIAFPLLSSGNYGYPKEQAVQTAVRAIRDFLAEYEMKVFLVLYDRGAVRVSKSLWEKIEEYIDDHYVEEKDECFFGDASNREFRLRGYPCPQAPARPPMVILPEESPHPMAFPQAAPRKLEDLISQLEETFSQMLLRLIDERGLKDSYVYKRANIDRRHFSKIRNDVHYAPNKKTVLAFAIALELSLDETKDLLMRAGFAFSRSSKFDVILCFFIENQKYDIFEINETLFAYGEPVLGE